MRDFDRESVGTSEEVVEQQPLLEETGNTKFSAHGTVPGVAPDGAAQERPSASELVYKDDGMSQLAGGVSKFLGGSFFSGASPNLTNSIHKRGVPDVQTDPGNKDFERGNTENAFKAGTLKPVDEVEGKTYTADGCWTGIGQVSFTFDRAAVGRFIDHNHVCAGAVIQMSVNHKNCGDPKAVRLVQVCREFTVDEKTQERRTAKPELSRNSKPDDIENERTRRSGYHWDDKANDWKENTGAKSAGWRVDSSVSNNSPWFGGTDDRHDGPSGHNGVDGKAAVQRDAPGTFAERAYDIGKEFRTCAVAYDESGRGVVLASIDWGYYCDHQGNVSFDTPTAYEGAKVETYDASDRWNAMESVGDKGKRYKTNASTGFERPMI